MPSRTTLDSDFASDSLHVPQPIDHRRQFLTFVLMLGFFLLWINVAPRLFPNLFGPAQPPAPAAAKNDPADAPEPIATPDADPGVAPEAPAELVQFPRRSVLMGDAAAGDLQRIELSSQGASITWQELTEKDFLTLDRKRQIRLLGNNPLTELRTLAVESPSFDIPLQKHGTSLADVDWELVEAESELIPKSKAYRKVVFRYPSPDGLWEARKTFTLKSGAGIDPTAQPDGYLLDVSLTFRHLSGGDARFTYDLQGPVGLPLENAENTRTFQAVKSGTLQGDTSDAVWVDTKMASTLVKDINKAIATNEPGQRPVIRYPVRWAGVDVQYFAALLVPLDDQLADANNDGEPESYFAEVVPTVVRELDPVERSDVSLVFKSRPLNVAGGADVTHRFQLYLGPKRVQLLESFIAQGIMDFGWFAPISKLMVGLLNFFHHSLLLPYGLAIVLLTVIVRGGMFPISKRQVANMQRMKELNPKLQEIRTKYANDKEAMGRAQLELMRKHGYNPLAGCLPMFLQLPIFIGLYNGLNAAIDLRLARFLWIGNLAAPDALFNLPFSVPFLGSQFNLLPLLTVALFIVQNKLFTPPPTNEEQALQYKMMNVMMAVMGIMFYHVPAGLCVYFIASSLWGIAERKILDRHKLALEAARSSATAPTVIETTATVKETDSREPGLIARLLAAADEAKHTTGGQSSSNRPDKSKKGGPRRR
jgi:YidC/Oxa1 family membrane protein insertase